MNTNYLMEQLNTMEEKVTPTAEFANKDFVPYKINGSLQSKNVRIHDRRTSVRLEPEMWIALNEIAVMEGCTVHDICGAVDDLKSPEASFTAALRVFVMEYYRALVKTNNRVMEVQKALKRQ